MSKNGKSNCRPSGVLIVVHHTLADRDLHQAIEKHFEARADKSRKRFVISQSTYFGEDAFCNTVGEDSRETLGNRMDSDERRKTNNLVQNLEDAQRRIHRSNHSYNPMARLGLAINAKSLIRKKTKTKVAATPQRSNKMAER